MGSSNFITCCLFSFRGSRRFRHFGGEYNGGNGVSGAGAVQSFALPASVLVIRQEDGGYESPSRMGCLGLGMGWDGARKHLVNGVMDMTFALLVSINLYNSYIYIYLSFFLDIIILYPRPSKGQVKLGRYTNSRPLPKDHRKPMLFIYINLHNGHVDLGNLGYVLTYIRGNPPNPTYTPQPQQQQLHINQFQVYKCQDCLKWPMVPKISMKSPWKDYKIPKQMSKT